MKISTAKAKWKKCPMHTYLGGREATAGSGPASRYSIFDRMQTTWEETALSVPGALLHPLGQVAAPVTNCFAPRAPNHALHWLPWQAAPQPGTT